MPANRGLGRPLEDLFVIAERRGPHVPWHSHSIRPWQASRSGDYQPAALPAAAERSPSVLKVELGDAFQCPPQTPPKYHVPTFPRSRCDKVTKFWPTAHERQLCVPLSGCA